MAVKPYPYGKYLNHVSRITITSTHARAGDVQAVLIALAAFLKKLKTYAERQTQRGHKRSHGGGVAEDCQGLSGPCRLRTTEKYIHMPVMAQEAMFIKFETHKK
ncbi:MAG: hypothetical protein HQK98_08730 [Nitrospirae bacterium]|nr:hypothetical protein [Nitrospirota bacterium]